MNFDEANRRPGGDGIWGDIEYPPNSYERGIHVLVDWDYLTSAEARSLALWLTLAADELDRRTAG